jgi:hypothetical protein
MALAVLSGRCEAIREFSCILRLEKLLFVIPDSLHLLSQKSSLNRISLLLRLIVALGFGGNV